MILIRDRRTLAFVFVALLCIIYLIDSMTEASVLEDTSLPVGMEKPGPKKTYDQFVRAANMDPSYKVSIAWINLIDATPYIPNYIKYKESLLTPVIDQSDCASCWAISVCHMIADRIAVYTGGKIKRPLSHQELLSCWNVRGDLGCTQGGSPENAYQHIIQNGIATNEDYPYVQAKSTDIVPCEPQRQKGFRTFLQKGSVRSLCRDPDQYQKNSKAYNRVITENLMNMRTELFLNGPFVTTIQVYSSLYEYDGLSIYDPAEQDLGKYIGGHACLCIGIVVGDVGGIEPGFDGDYFVLKNSWSASWPLKSPASKGYAYVRAGKNLCGVESRSSRALPVLTDEIRRHMVKSLDSVRYISYNSYIQDPERQLVVTKSTKLRALLK